MLAVVGTVPDPDFPVSAGEVALSGGRLRLDNRAVDINRGTPALLAAAIKTAECLGQSPIMAFLAGDTGLGHGSRLLYEYLIQNVKSHSPGVITFHYLQPDVDWHNRVLFELEELKVRPFLIADAGFMYAAKMSGMAGRYDLFTPDIGELAFLADEDAPHPFYTRGFILHQENKAPELIARAYAHDNAAQYLLVKGQPDLLARNNKVLASIDQPIVDVMEAIGGTGDTLTGIVSALIASGMAIEDAAVVAAKSNRLAGYLAEPNPASQIIDIVDKLPEALEIILTERGNDRE
jgi:NAD(P)H-hydrate repair Nnr-like enzyme with NAD(P)H-hydrate dehydratase domain